MIVNFMYISTDLKNMSSIRFNRRITEIQLENVKTKHMPQL